ncbi:MAG: SAM-dependent methyltransferase [Flavobacteriales bacterium]|nr:SAM-dependent methyltransferase [Flavobacteriales bacterium]
MAKGKLYIVPIPISENTLEKVIPDFNHNIVKELRFFVVEKLKTARQFLRKMDRTFPIDDSEFFELNKHNDYDFDHRIFKELEAGNNVGLMSESGYPTIADPGSQFVAKAHQKQIEIIPLVGPSSIFMALAASGLNGQGFSFNGYIPQKDPERSKRLKQCGDLAKRNVYAQIFIETPYRNQRFFEDVIKLLDPSIKLCIAYDVSGEKEKIQTKTVKEWKESSFAFDKTPCIFILGY